MRIVFCWKEEHPHTLNAIQKMVLASGLPYEPNKFKKGQPRLVYGPAPAKGQRAEREYVDIYLLELRNADEVRQALLKTAPKGFEMLQVTRVPYPLPSVQNLAVAVRYRVKGDFSPFVSLGRKLEDWNHMSNLTVTLRNEIGVACQRDITAGFLAARVTAPDEVELTLAPINGRWQAPQWFIAAWLGQEIPVPADDFAVEGLVFIREGFYWQDSQGELHLI